MKKTLLMLLLAVCFSMSGMSSKAEAAFEYAPVAFVLVDYSGNTKESEFLSWREQVRQAYYMPYYELIKNHEPDAVVRDYLKASSVKTNKLQEENLQEIADKISAKVVVLLFINNYSERLVRSFGHFWHERGDLLQRVVVSADIYIYKVTDGQFLKRKIRYVDTDDISLSTAASDIVKYRLRNYVNEMEGREQI
ncbi:MAG TPA: hypothetical protein IAB06_07390 [Candidatus Avacidaminococcus intestinavium]|uniref:Lipoprotein n=1 Tax=Candidatus Avacidaminococcus intestinavium TaxID=2840684 RepID=A0A9D1SM93_9FIRM|nr:hypothetical protein [Candidatus Avacidaminococcus intestinavium]